MRFLETSIISELEKILGPKYVSFGESERAIHGRDQSSHPLSMPAAVVWPKSTEQTSLILRLASNNRIPVVGWGAGSSLEGNPIPIQGGIVIDFRRMNQVLNVHDADFQVTVQPGLLYKDMNKALRQYGLFFAPDPGANASIGGMIANNAAGTRTVKYGATRDNILALEVVLANGDVMRTGSRSVKQSAGYDLTHLIIGSEGTLGLVTEATLKIAPMPEHFSAALATFENTSAAAAAVLGIIGSGLNPAALELLDAFAITFLNLEDGIDLRESPTLLMEFHGAAAESVKMDVNLAQEICMELGAGYFERGVGRGERDRLWHGRHNLGEILFRMHPGQISFITDVSVPISSYPELATYAASLVETMGLRGALIGHAGDGNLHTHLFSHDDDLKMLGDLQLFNDRLVSKALNLKGTCTGEHGVGLGKMKYMVQEHGQTAVDIMRQIKATLDPQNILNPGKILD